MSLLSFLRGKPICEPEKDSPDPVLEYPYGEPDDVIVIDPTRINHPAGVILFYKEKGLLNYNGKDIPIREIADITSINVANPYQLSSYQIIFTMNSNEKFTIPASDEPDFANSVLLSIAAIRESYKAS